MRIHLVLTILVKSCWTQIAIKGPNRGFGAIGSSSSSAIGLEQQQSNSLSRSRRFAIPSGSGTTLTTDLTFKLTVPIEGLDTSLVTELPFSYALSLGSRRKKRDVSHHFSERMSVLRKIESYLPNVVPIPQNATGHDCVLRAICEVAKTPRNDDGLFGDFINLLLTPEHILDLLPGQESDYLVAQRSGKDEKDCSKFEKNCSLTMFEYEDVPQVYISGNPFIARNNTV